MNDTSPHGAAERGVVLIWALLTAFIIAGFVLASSDEIRAVDEQANFSFSVKGQAEVVARAGLTDALAWFRRQSSQPVVDFRPKGLPPALRPGYSMPSKDKLPVGILSRLGAGDPWDLATEEGAKDYKTRTNGTRVTVSYELNGAAQSFSFVPGQSGGVPAGIQRELDAAAYYSLLDRDSETPEVGLVRTYELTPEIWARYSVFRGDPSEPFTDRNGNGRHEPSEPFDDVNGDGKWSPGRHARDVGSSRGVSSAGTIWYLTSRGEIFRRRRPDLALGEGPNERLAMTTWGTEIRRLALGAPAAAALCVQDGGRCRLGARSSVRGTTAIAFSREGGDPQLRGGKAYGALAPMPEFDTSFERVFGLPWTRLTSMADIHTTQPGGTLPARMPKASLVTAQGTVTFTADTPLAGYAIVVVKGDVTLERGSNSYFTGVLYVDGDLVVNGPALLRGTVIVTGSVEIRGAGSEMVELEHDADIVGELLGSIGQYRGAKAPFRARGKIDSAGSAPAAPNPADPRIIRRPPPFADPAGGPAAQPPTAQPPGGSGGSTRGSGRSGRRGGRRRR